MVMSNKIKPIFIRFIYCTLGIALAWCLILACNVFFAQNKYMKLDTTHFSVVNMESSNGNLISLNGDAHIIAIIDNVEVKNLVINLREPVGEEWALQVYWAVNDAFYEGKSMLQFVDSNATQVVVELDQPLNILRLDLGNVMGQTFSIDSIEINADVATPMENFIDGIIWWRILYYALILTIIISVMKMTDKASVQNKVLAAISLGMAVINYLVNSPEVEAIFNIKSNKVVEFALWRTLSFVISIGIYFLLAKTIATLVDKGKNYTYAKFFVCYFLINIGVLLLVWPGIFKGDEFYIIPDLMENLQIDWMQTFQTCAQYIMSLCIYPWVAGITFIQIIVITVFATDIFRYVSMCLKNSKWAWLLLVPFVFLPVLDNNQFSLRASIISWIFTDVIVTIIYCARENTLTEIKNLVKIAVLSTFISVWKMEYIYLVAIILAVAFITAVVKKLSWKRFGILVLTVCVTYTGFNLPSKLESPENNYIFTAFMTPLGHVVRDNYDDFITNEDLKEEYELINSITPVDIMKTTSSGLNLPGSYYFISYIEPSVKIDYIIASLKVCLYYYDTFAFNRIYLYQYTNAMIPDRINHTGWEDKNISLELYYGYDQYYFDDHFNHTDPVFGDQIRRLALSLITCRQYGDYMQTNILYPITYNSMIPLIVIIGLAIYEAIKKNWKMILVHLSLIAIAVITFILAPAHFWMYYMPFYLSSYTVIMVYVINALDNRKRKEIGYEEV